MLVDLADDLFLARLDHRTQSSQRSLIVESSPIDFIDLLHFPIRLFLGFLVRLSRSVIDLQTIFGFLQVINRIFNKVKTVSTLLEFLECPEKVYLNFLGVSIPVFLTMVHFLLDCFASFKNVIMLLRLFFVQLLEILQLFVT